MTRPGTKHQRPTSKKADVGKKNKAGKETDKEEKAKLKRPPKKTVLMVMIRILSVQKALLRPNDPWECPKCRWNKLNWVRVNAGEPCLYT